VQLELPPWSQFQPLLLQLVVYGWIAAWVWSLWLDATRADEVKGLPAWAWALVLVLMPLTVPLFLALGAPISTRALGKVVLAAAIAVIAGVAVVAIQQIGIMDCQIVDHGRTRVCTMEPRSMLLPLVIAAIAFIGAIPFLRERRPAAPRSFA
jgi:hypothetical protein